MQRILVTGGAGFIGHRVANLLQDEGVAIAIYDNLLSGLPMPTLIRPEHGYVADIRDWEKLRLAFEHFKPTVVVHLAAIHHIPTCEMERAEALNVNIVGTELVLKAAQDYKVQRFVLASSGAVYDWIEGGLDELRTPLRARDNYALSKLTNEQQVQFWRDRNGRQIRIARIFNTIGYDDPNAHLIPDILSQLKQGSSYQRIRLGNVGSRRDYIHADDTARAISLLATSDPKSGNEIFNIGTGKSVSVTDLVAMIGAAIGCEIEIETDSSRMRPVDRPDQLGSHDLLEQNLGFKPIYNVRDAIIDIVERWHGKATSGSVS